MGEKGGVRENSGVPPVDAVTNATIFRRHTQTN